MNYQEFIKLRRNGVGGSDVAPILNLSPYSNAYEVYLEKTSSELKEGEIIDGPLYWGKLLESVIKEEFQKRKGKLVKDAQPFIQHSEYDFLFANLDGLTEDSIVEFKKSKSHNSWGEPDSENIPIEYSLQAQHYLNVLRSREEFKHIDRVDFGVYFSVQDTFQTFTYTHDEKCGAEILNACIKFWKNYVIPRKEPEQRNYIKVVPGNSFEAKEEFYKKCKEVKELRRLIQKHETQKKILEEEIKWDFLNNEAALNSNGDVIATHKTCYRESLDMEKALIAFPDLKSYYKKTPYNILRIR